MNDGVEQAWRLYRDRNVVVGKYRAEIAERRRLMMEWRKEGEPLR